MNTSFLRGAALAAACAFGVASPAFGQTVSKTVDNAPYHNRALWTIDKSADHDTLLLACDQAFDVNYTVTVTKVAQIGETHLDGTITVTNNTVAPVTLTDLDDIVQASSNPALQVPLGVTCPVALPYVMAAGEVLNCTYAGRVYEPTNTQVHNRNEAIATFSGGGTVSSGLIPFNIAPQPDPQLDSCVEVSDDLQGYLGQVCFQVNNPAEFNYTRQVGPFPAPGVYPVINTASFYGVDSGPGGAPDPVPDPGGNGSATGEASWTVTATVVCGGDGGCTRTIGYWKTHSEYGPAGPADPTWEELPGGLGPDTPFLNSGVTWYTLFWTAPAGGNGYIKLAHQWMGATLNVMAGADGGVLGTILADAQALMTANPSCRTNWRGCPNSVKTQFEAWHTTLDDYNNGELAGGPPHCDEEAPAATSQGLTIESDYALGTPMPNPTNGSASIRFDVPESSQVLMVAYDLMGREVARLADDFYPEGTHEVVFDGANLPAGTYFIRMTAGEFRDVTRVVLAR